MSSPLISDLDSRERAGMPNSQRYLKATTWEADQLTRWGEVGRCVVAQDRDGSAAYLAAKAGSVEARAATLRLSPAFGACLTGSGIIAKGNKAYRRAAVADALARAPAANR